MGRARWTRKRWAWVGAVALALGVLGVLVMCSLRMPGRSYEGAIPGPSDAQSQASERLRRHVEVLASEIVTRDVAHPQTLEAAAQYIEERWTEQGRTVSSLPYQVEGTTVRNLEVELPGGDAADEIVVIGAHYDSAFGLPGADDNASGVAALLELSARLADLHPARTVRFVAFVNEEPPYFKTDLMGSLVHARASSSKGENVVAMLSLETIGYYRDEPGTQQYPGPLETLYGDRGNFISFVATTGSTSLVREVTEVFREHAEIPSEGIAAPGSIPGIDWSDHWSYAREGYKAVMVTDTAPNRNPNYHTEHDTPDTLDYHRLTLVVDGLEGVIRHLAGG